MRECRNAGGGEDAVIRIPPVAGKHKKGKKDMNAKKETGKTAEKKTRYYIGKKEYTLAQVKALAKENEGCAALARAAGRKAARDE